MRKKIAVILWLVLISAVNCFAVPPPVEAIKTDIVTIAVQQQHDPVNPHSKSALAIHFQLRKNWHFYASAETAPGGMNLKIKPTDGEIIRFSEPVFPQSQLYFDKSSGKKLQVFSDTFTVYLPFRSDDTKTISTKDIIENINVSIKGAVCSDVQCRMPDFGDLSTKIRISLDTTMGEAEFTVPAEKSPGTPVRTTTYQRRISSAWGALLLAFLAGLSLNIMPCVWPVLPIIVMRIVEHAKHSKGKSVALGLAFCLGILLFFACLAGANIILQVFYGTVLQWGDQFRNPVFVAGMAFLLVILALFMFGVFTIVLPSSVTSKSSSGKGVMGSVGMGFLAAILSTPCSFAILAAAFAWAQAQPLLLATVAIMVIGLGMAVPYAILTSMPSLLKKTPKPGRWMELFKQAIGFVLFGIAVKMITALPQNRIDGVLYFTVVLSFCLWMWGNWVNFSTPKFRKWLVRIIASALAVAGGWVFLSVPTDELINWQKYDADLIERALAADKPVVIKFTADWCLSCHAVEKTVYSREDIAQLIKEKKVLAIKADTTTKDLPATVALKNLYNEPGVPVSMLFIPGEREPIRWNGIFFADELKEHLEKLK